MNQELWTAIDQYLSEKLVAQEPALEAALAASEAAGLPPHNVAPNQGQMLRLFAQMVGARRILEVGTLGGYSTLWLAGALPPEGQLVTLEAEPRHAAVARENFARAGLGARIELRLGPALDSLPALAAERPEPFDLVFIDADKRNNAAYFDWALRLCRRGSVIIVDNVIRNGAILDAGSADPSVQGVRQLNERLAHEPRVSTTAIQTVGSKGYDGFILARVR